MSEPILFSTFLAKPHCLVQATDLHVGMSGVTADFHKLADRLQEMRGLYYVGELAVVPVGALATFLTETKSGLSDPLSIIQRGLQGHGFELGTRIFGPPNNEILTPDLVIHHIHNQVAIQSGWTGYAQIVDELRKLVGPSAAVSWSGASLELTITMPKWVFNDRDHLNLRRKLRQANARNAVVS